jgi:NAD(P)-dependent dehydrogenase (short-subunit alcohol dehydrogenase family)
MLVVITGATAGIGLSCVKALIAEGHEVIGMARGEDALRDLEKECPGFKGLRCDIADAGDLEALGDRLREIAGERPLDVLVNNAGYGAAGPVELVSLADWKAQYDTNLFGTVGVIQAALPLLRRSSRARIINVSSLAGDIYVPFFAPYYSTKHALNCITNALRLELREQGIDVVSVCPGAVKTGFASSEDAMLESFAEESSLYRAGIGRIIRWHKRLVKDGIEAEDVRDVVLKAIHSERPKNRYLVPAFPAVLILPILSLLPDRAGDALLTRLTSVKD